MLADDLKTLLASNFAYYVKAQMFHWNVEGPDFVQLHELFSEIYEFAYSGHDKIAEYIRTLDDYAPGSLERFQELSQIPGQTKIPRARLMLEEILSDTETMKTLVMSTFASAQQEGREDVANFMAERQEGLGKYAWQLKATLKDSRA